jgi:hypothetical protein
LRLTHVIIQKDYTLECNAAECGKRLLAFRRTILPTSSQPKTKAKQETSMKYAASRSLTEDGTNNGLRKPLDFCQTTRRYIPENSVI